MRVAFIFLSLIILTSCKKDLGDCFKGTGDITTEIRELPPFTHIEVYDNVDLYITQDTLFEAKVEAGEKLIGKVKLKVEKGILKITNENDCNWVRSLKNEFKVYLSVADFKELTCYGTGEIASTNTITSDTVLVDLWETYSNISLQVTAKYVHAKNHTGPGDIKIVGSTDYFYSYTTGNGFIDCDELVSKKTFALNGGTGEVYVNAQESLYAEINYIGNIHYAGQPTTIELNDNGDGELIPLTP